MIPQIVSMDMARPHGRPIPYLRAWRDVKLITATELSEQADISRTALSRIEHGGNAAYSTIKKLADALGITTDELLSAPKRKA